MRVYLVSRHPRATLVENTGFMSLSQRARSAADPDEPDFAQARVLRSRRVFTSRPAVEHGEGDAWPSAIAALAAPLSFVAGKMRRHTVPQPKLVG
jgi:hypothetical protein